MHPIQSWALWRCSADTHMDIGHTLTTHQQSELLGLADKQKAEEPPSWNQALAARPTWLLRPCIGAKGARNLLVCHELMYKWKAFTWSTWEAGAKGGG